MGEDKTATGQCALPEIIAKYFNNTWEIDLYTGISVTLGLQSIILNYTILTFYFRQPGRNKVIPFLYKVISTFDLLSGITGFLNAGYFAILNSDDLPGVVCFPLSQCSDMIVFKRIVMIVSYMSTAYFSATAAFLHTMLTVIRCINISLPFYQLVLRQIKVVLWWYVSLMCLFILVDTSYVLYISYARPPQVTESYFYYTIFVRIVSMVKLAMIERGSSTTRFSLHLALDLVLPFILPCLICMVCLVILVYTLTRSGGVGTNRRENRREKDTTNERKAQQKDERRTQHHITRTVTMLTALFVLCNSFQIITITLQKYFNTVGDSQVWHGKAAAIVFCIVPLFNAAINPLIFISRSKVLKSYIKTSFRRGSLHKNLFKTKSGQCSAPRTKSEQCSDPHVKENLPLDGKVTFQSNTAKYHSNQSNK